MHYSSSEILTENPSFEDEFWSFFKNFTSGFYLKCKTDKRVKLAAISSNGEWNSNSFSWNDSKDFSNDFLTGLSKKSKVFIGVQHLKFLKDFRSWDPTIHSKWQDVDQSTTDDQRSIRFEESYRMLELEFEIQSETTENGTLEWKVEWKGVHTDALDLKKGSLIEFLEQHTLVYDGVENYYRIKRVEEAKRKQRSDQVVYDEETEKYTSALLPYGTSVGAPSIVPDDINTWKNVGINKVNHHLKTRFRKMKEEYEEMLRMHEWNEILYKTKFGFEPIIGETYYLYRNSKKDLFLSLISPDQWNREYVGTFRLNNERIWELLDHEEDSL